MKIPALLTCHWFRPPVGVVVLVLVAFGLLAGSVTRRFRSWSDLHRTRESVRRESQRLAQLHEDLQRVATDRLDDRFRTLTSQLPEDAAGVRSWLTEVQCLAANHHLTVLPTWGEAEAVSGPKGRIERIQVTLELRPEMDITAKAKTAAVVRWLRDLELDQPPLELHRVQFSGTNQGLSLALVTGRLWIRAAEPSNP